jgi:hypothetical protein
MASEHFMPVSENRFTCTTRHSGSDLITNFFMQSERRPHDAHSSAFSAERRSSIENKRKQSPMEQLALELFGIGKETNKRESY